MRSRALVLGVMMAALAGCAVAERAPRVVVNRYEYQAVPPAAAGGIPVTAPATPQPVPYQTVYPAKPFSDPTVAIVRNDGDDALHFSIDGKQSIVLAPGAISANINLGPGEHTLRWWVEVRTTHPEHPTLKSREQMLHFSVRAEEGTKVFSLRVR